MLTWLGHQLQQLLNCPLLSTNKLVMSPVVPTGQASQRNVDELPGYEDPPAPAPTADSPFVSPMSDGFMLFLQSHNRRPDSPYPGRGAYEARTDTRSHASGLNLPHALDSPASSSSPSSALSLPDEDDSLPGSPRRRSSSSPPYSPTSPYYSHMSPAHPSGGFHMPAIRSFIHTQPCNICHYLLHLHPV